MVVFAPPPGSDRSAGGLFAPPHVAGDPASAAAIDAWNAQHHYLTRAEVEATRMPPPFAPATTGLKGQSNVVAQQNIGTVDPAALLAAAQGVPYDIEARRNAIAARIMENEAAQAAGGVGGAGSTGSKNVFTGNK
jgi:hypothetical protein